MRLFISLVVASVLWSTLAVAKPKVAVAPLDGDDDGKVSELVHEAAAHHATVTSSKIVGKALKELSIADPDDARAAKRLRKHLKVDAVIYGKVVRDGTKKKVKLSIYTRGKKPERFELEFKVASSRAFHEHLRDELASRLAPDETNKDDADEATPPAEDVKPTRTASSDDVKPKRSASADDARPRRTASTDDDDGGRTTSVHKHAHHHRAADADRDYVTQAAVFADGGLGFVHRTLTYVANAGGMTPPRVGTPALGLQLDGEAYPGAFDSLDGLGAAIGVFASVNKAVGLAIQLPGTTQSAPIDETSYQIGLRYRFVFGQSSLAAGLSYWNQTFVADRSTLTSPTELNMPDTTYKGIAPGVLLRVGVVPGVGVTLQADLPLMFDSGPITDPTYFGAASIIAFAVQAGVDFSLGRHYGLHIGGFFDQESLSFQSGMITSATDRTMGFGGTFALMY